MIDLNQAIQPIVMGQLAGQGEHKISLEGMKQGLHTAGNAVGSLPGIRNTKLGGMLQKGAFQDKVNKAVSKVLEKQSIAEDKLAAAMLPKRMNQLNQQMRKEFGKDWRDNPNATGRYLEELADINDSLKSRAWTSVYAQEKWDYSPQVANRYAEDIIEDVATKEELIQEVTGRIPHDKGLSKQKRGILEGGLTNDKE